MARPEKNNGDVFWSRVSKQPDGCWIWTHNKMSQGYGVFYYKGKLWRAHRLAYFLIKGEIKEWVLHSCDVTSCCNPDHLRDGSPLDNAKDAMDRKRHPMFKKTHCPSGHEYSGRNVYVTKENVRHCRACTKVGMVKLAQKKKRELDEFFNAYSF